MRPSYIFGALLSATAPAFAASCNADNCYRAVLGTVRGQSLSHVADCSSFIACTSTGAPVTTTLTQTVTPSNAVVFATFTPAGTSVSVTSTPDPTTAVQTVTPAPVVLTTTVTPTPLTTTVTVTQFPTYAKRENLRKRVTSPVTTAQSPAVTTQTSGAVCGVSTVPSYASACSGTARYISACSCGGATGSTTYIPGSTVTVITTVTQGQQTVTSAVTLAQQTSTVTVTLPQQTSTVTVTLSPATSISATTLPQQTATATAAPPPPPQCNNAGLQWAYYPDSQTVDASYPSTYQNYNPAVVKAEPPSSSGTTPWIGFYNQDGSDGSIYNSGSSLPGERYILNHRGYIYAPETGTYKLEVDGVDDVVNSWFGSSAYSGWTKSNAVQDITFINGRSNIYSIQLVAGTYTPFRLVFKQGPGTAEFFMSITSPSGVTLINSDPNFQPNSYVVQYSCDQAAAPPFQPFGQET